MDKGSLILSLGYNVDNNDSFKLNLAKFNSMLITGRYGKTTLLYDILLQLVSKNSPEDLNIVMVDAKGAREYGDFVKLPHVISDIPGGEKCVEETNKYLEFILHNIKRNDDLMSRARVPSVKEFNELHLSVKIPTTIVIIDELILHLKSQEFEKLFYDIMMSNRLDGYKFIFTSQRADRDVVDALFRSFMDAIITFKVSDERTSYHIIERPGAELLEEKNCDMLVLGPVWQNYGFLDWPKEMFHHVKGKYVSTKDFDEQTLAILNEYQKSS